MSKSYVEGDTVAEVGATVSYFLLRVLHRGGVKAVSENQVGVLIGHTVIRRMIPPGDAPDAIVIRPPELAVMLQEPASSNDSGLSVDLIPIPDATSDIEAKAWLVDHRFYVDKVPDVVHYALLDLKLEWLNTKIN